MFTILFRRKKDNALKKFRNIINLIVIFISPFSILALVRMFNTAQKTVNNRLRLLYSVLNVPLLLNLFIKLFHFFFRDFFFKPGKALKL